MRLKKPKDILSELPFFCMIWGMIWAYRWLVFPRTIVDLWFLVGTLVVFLTTLTILVIQYAQARMRRGK